jgi:hypothetical protein
MVYAARVDRIAVAGVGIGDDQYIDASLMQPALSIISVAVKSRRCGRLQARFRLVPKPVMYTRQARLRDEPRGKRVGNAGATTQPVPDRSVRRRVVTRSVISPPDFSPPRVRADAT